MCCLNFYSTELFVWDDIKVDIESVLCIPHPETSLSESNANCLLWSIWNVEEEWVSCWHSERKLCNRVLVDVIQHKHETKQITLKKECVLSCFTAKIIKKITEELLVSVFAASGQFQCNMVLILHMIAYLYSSKPGSICENQQKSEENNEHLDVKQKLDPLDKVYCKSIHKMLRHSLHNTNVSVG